MTKDKLSLKGEGGGGYKEERHVHRLCEICKLFVITSNAHACLQTVQLYIPQNSLFSCGVCGPMDVSPVPRSLWGVSLFFPA